MYRSFTDRVFGGVCGGLAALLPINVWAIRLLFVLLSILTTGAFAALYLILWWLVPQDSLAARQRGGAGLFLLTVILTLAVVAGFFLSAAGQLRSTTGADLYWPGLLLLVCAAFFFRQVRP